MSSAAAAASPGGASCMKQKPNWSQNHMLSWWFPLVPLWPLSCLKWHWIPLLAWTKKLWWISRRRILVIHLGWIDILVSHCMQVLTLGILGDILFWSWWWRPSRLVIVCAGVQRLCLCLFLIQYSLLTFSSSDLCHFLYQYFEGDDLPEATAREIDLLMDQPDQFRQGVCFCTYILRGVF